MKLHILGSAIAAALAFTPANATIHVVYGDRDGGIAAFDSTVVTAGSTVQTDHLTGLSGGLSIARDDFTMSKNNGSFLSVYGIYNAGGGEFTTGQTLSINPQGSGPGIGGIGSGITFDFVNPVNAIGFEVGDWATCCQPSGLYISFDDGAPIQVGMSTVYGDQFLTNGRPIVFVSAFDDSGSFTKVQFWGDGYGEVLTAGGTVRYALLDEGSLPPAIPEPATWALMIAGFGLVGFAARRRRAVTA